MYVTPYDISTGVHVVAMSSKRCMCLIFASFILSFLQYSVLLSNQEKPQIIICEDIIKKRRTNKDYRIVVDKTCSWNS